MAVATSYNLCQARHWQHIIPRPTWHQHIPRKIMLSSECRFAQGFDKMASSISVRLLIVKFLLFYYPAQLSLPAEN